MAKTKNTPPKVHVAHALTLLRHNAGLTVPELARMVGVSKQAMTERLMPKNTSVGVACEVADALGYEMALVPKGSDYPEGSIRIEAALSEKHDLGGRR